MSSKGFSYGSGYSDLISSLSPEELEELLFGYPSSPLKNMGIWSWANDFNSTPSSPPALATLSKASSTSPSLEGKEVSKTSSIEAYDGYNNPSHPYNLCPRDRTGWVVKPFTYLKQVVFPSTLFFLF
ncbi:hypothetical protein O181_026031 [Austropuccinia psidii MF-1]|uniref:Uncharacterized protein n=1 Tax=Austropuccinia psidii MF-1 TaxID=1389203 RepID=A0A9Q3CJQ5_9BASI|nr:hypothetical protein [Austropuccinia psidii MF-1]